MKQLYWRSLSLSLLSLVLVACPSGGTPPQISSFDPLTLEFTGKTGQKLESQFSFKNTGGSDLNYSISEDADWLEVLSGQAGTVTPGNTQVVKASATCPNTPTTLSGVLKVSATGITGSKDLTVNLKCSAPDTTPDGFSFAAASNVEPDSDIT
jgi:hypothetical protein